MITTFFFIEEEVKLYSFKPAAVIASQSQHTDDEKFKMISPWITKREEII